MTDPTTIVVLAKAPRPGRVKTRLCPPFTPVEAAALAEAALCDTLAAARATPDTIVLLALDGPRGPWCPPGTTVVAQHDGGLDRRIAGALRDAGGPAVLVGMDTPQVTPALLAEAVDALASPDVDTVLGPTDDGGYWIIGARATDPRMVVGVPMSRPDTGAAQQARLDALGCRTHRLPRLVDVDTAADARRVAHEAPTTRFARTLAALDRRAPVRGGR